MRWIGFVLLIAISAGGAPGANGSDDAGLQFFETKIRPLLVENCYKCHSVTAKKIKANLYLDSREGILKGGDSGPAIVPGHPEKSRMMEAISWVNPDLEMPPKQQLGEQQIADFTNWVKMGAPWPAGESSKPVAAVRVFDLPKRKASHWCWELIKRPTPPDVKDLKWSQSPIDRFILAKIEQGGLRQAGPADRHVLIRRAYFDMIGLPPTPEEVDAFVNDPSPDAFAKVVDHLLASEHFGERWARHWMDIVRYGETRGHEFDYVIPNAWQYRDYLIRAFNADVPYNQFVTEHIAGDLLKEPRLNPQAKFNESVLGTGFWFLGEEVHSPVDIRQDEADRLNNRIDTMTKAFLGLTVGCARCHDHKFDAISQKDFYALTGFTLSSGYRQVPFGTMEQNRRAAEKIAACEDAERPHFLRELIGCEHVTLENLTEYLLASRQVIVAGPGAAGKAGEIADARGIDPGVLRGWVQELAKAKVDENHPMHAFALAAYDPAIDQPAGFTAFRAKLVDTIHRQQQQSAELPRPDQVILDFDAQTPAPPWYSDGIAFGSGPVRAGQLLLGATVEQPILGVARWGMARRRPFIKDQGLSPGTEADPGGLGGWRRAGQTIRTPKVTLKTGQLWYLVRGAGRAYAVVDSHLMIGGPLHGRLLMGWGTDKRQNWTWIHQDLSPYAGQRCHVEFSPNGEGTFEIAKVIEAERAPAIETPNAAVTAAVSDPSINSLEALARAYQKLFIATSDRLSAGTISGASDVHDQAALADFLARGSRLFCGTVPLRALHQGLVDNAPSALPELAKSYVATQTHNAAEVVLNSPTAPAMWEGNGVDENVLIRGVAKNTGDVVPRRFLEAIAGANQKPYPVNGSGRLQLVDAMLAENDPFVSRVMVNRVWQHLFGRGIVPTVDNFGVLGQPPTHPELLDYLADNFRKEQAWSIKKLIRSIMLSSTYQMSSKPPAASDEADPRNLTLNHMPIKRLEGEPIRDAILAVSGRLDGKIGGAPVDVYLTQFMEGRGRPGGGPLDGNGRRSIYTRIRRNFLSPMMLAFDQPIPFACVGRRNVSNVPAQALILMNDPLVVQQAQLWAKHVLAEPGKSADDRVREMYMTALSRHPSSQELKEATAFLDQQGEAYGLNGDARLTDPRPWADLCHVMFNLKEFIFIE